MKKYITAGSNEMKNLHISRSARTKSGMKRVLVSGGAGFIGSHVVNELEKRGNEVVVLDNYVGGKNNLKYLSENVEIIEGDMCDREACKKALKDV
ncbi:MAG: NAD-dependent epimerase/dehydratase family protein, partial [Candidatus Diapherotrites archaeon]